MEFYLNYSTGYDAGILMASDFLDSHFAGMGLVRNVNGIMLSCIRRGEDVEAQADKITKSIDEQVERSIGFLDSILADGTRVVTVSRSSHFEKALDRYSDRIDHVYVLESRPVLEGISLHRSLRKKGINSTLVTDAAMGKAAVDSDIALTGSDAVLGDFTLVHKTGTFPLFATMDYLGKSNYALSISLKEERKFDFDSYPEFRKHPCGELEADLTDCQNIYLEKVPEKLVTTVISDKGVSTRPVK